MLLLLLLLPGYTPWRDEEARRRRRRSRRWMGSQSAVCLLEKRAFVSLSPSVLFLPVNRFLFSLFYLISSPIVNQSILNSFILFASAPPHPSSSLKKKEEKKLKCRWAGAPGRLGNGEGVEEMNTTTAALISLRYQVFFFIIICGPTWSCSQGLLTRETLKKRLSRKHRYFKHSDVWSRWLTQSWLRGKSWAFTIKKGREWLNSCFFLVFSH